MLNNEDVFQALLKVENNIQKLDSAYPETVELLDCPRGNFNLEKVVGQLKKFEGKVIIQTMFVKGSFKGNRIDNTTEKEIWAWIELLKIIQPSQVMIYTIARDTPIDTLEKIPFDKLNEIAGRVEKAGFKVQVSA
jgi:wyosine [tRNA(Phe)-imidazoG37] synthetase (radical SAM superfamily)